MDDGLEGKMYKTRKYRLLLDQNSKEILNYFKKVYMQELKRLLRISKKRKIRKNEISEDIHDPSKWYLIKVVEKDKGHVFKKVGIFHRNSFAFSRKALTLYFGNSFIVSQLEIAVACDEEEWDQLLHNYVIRIDLFYDCDWYVNIVVVERYGR